MAQVIERLLSHVMEHPPREPVNGWIHFVGAVLAAVGLVVLTEQARRQGSARHVVAATVFGATATLMFATSALYHLRRTSPRALLLQRLDHAMIYLFIAGTYTPVCLVALWPTATGRLLLAAVWALALVGVLQEVRSRRYPRGVATAIYLGLGWAGVVAAPAMLRFAGPAFLTWLAVGGVFYSAGAVLYWRQWPRGWHGVFGFHEMWHACVLAACASHFWAIRTYVLTLA
jgi:hemolysin III